MSESPLNRVPDDTHAAEDDAALVTRIAAGDRTAFKQFYERHYHPLLRFIGRMTGRVDSAQEGVNDVMLVVWRNVGSFRGGSKVSTWLFGIAYRKGLRLVESRRRWSDRFRPMESVPWSELSSASTSPTDRAELEDWLERGMRQLPPKQRAVIELTYYYGYSYAEIATITECPENTVKTRMFHARSRLREMMPSLGDEGVKP